jgi:hypothetical protein
MQNWLKSVFCAPELMNTDLEAVERKWLQNWLTPVCMGSGLAAPLRPGMT